MKKKRFPKHIWPVVIVQDRYGGSYSGFKFIAFNADVDEVSAESQGWAGSDTVCFDWWAEARKSKYFYQGMYIGRGDTPDKALESLHRRITKSLNA